MQCELEESPHAAARTRCTTEVPTPRVRPIFRMPMPAARSSRIRVSTDELTGRQSSRTPRSSRRPRPLACGSTGVTKDDVDPLRRLPWHPDSQIKHSTHKAMILTASIGSPPSIWPSLPLRPAVSTADPTYREGCMWGKALARSDPQPYFPAVISCVILTASKAAMMASYTSKGLTSSTSL